MVKRFNSKYYHSSSCHCSDFIVKFFVLSTHRVTKVRRMTIFMQVIMLLSIKRLNRIIRTLSCIRLMVRNIPAVSLQMKVRV